MFWTVIIIIGVVAMVVGPVSLMRPNPTEQRLEALRAEARRLGLVVRLRRTADIDSNSNKLLPVYALPVPCHRHWRLTCCDYEHPLHLAKYWQMESSDVLSATERDLLTRYLENLPPGVERVESAAIGVYAHWRERGGERELLCLYDCLRQIQGLATASKP